MVGDAFLDRIYHELQTIRSEAKPNKRADPYIYEMYNVKSFYKSALSNNKDVPSRIINSLVDDALEENIHLPRFIVVVLHDELLTHINHYQTGLRAMIGGIINWVSNNICRAIDFRKKDLLKYRPGAVTPGEPKVIWTKFTSFNINRQNQNVEVKTKYNDTMDEILAEKKDHLIMDLNEEMHNPIFFTAKNNLTHEGRIHFWNSLSEMIKAYDYGEEDLLPNTDIRGSSRAQMPNNSNNNNRNRLDTFRNIGQNYRYRQDTSDISSYKTIQYRERTNDRPYATVNNAREVQHSRNQHDEGSRTRNDRYHDTSKAKRQLNF